MPVIEDMFLQFGTPKSAPSPIPTPQTGPLRGFASHHLKAGTVVQQQQNPTRETLCFFKIKMKKKTFFGGWRRV